MNDKNGLTTVTFELLTERRVAELGREAIAPLDGASCLLKTIESALAPIIQSAPEVGVAIAQSGKYLVEFTTDGNAALTDGALRFLQRTDGKLQPTLVNEINRFQENATLIGRAGQKIAAAVAIAHVVVLLAVQAQLVTMKTVWNESKKN